MPVTYEPIATTTLSSAQSSVSFSSIPGTYTDLVLVSVASLNTADDVFVRFNSDTNNNYSYTLLYGSGSAAGSVSDINNGRLLIDYYGTPSTTNGDCINIFTVMNYSNATTYKTALTRANRASSGVDALVGLWRSTSAINTITLTAGASTARTFSSGSTFTLYGIKAA